MKNVYEQCPIYETESFILRLVKLEDAEDLLACYSDKDNVSKFNDDFCTSDFYYSTVSEMEDCIKFWLEEYQNQYYVRFSVINKADRKAIGTVEIFGGEAGVLRIDLSSKNNTEESFGEILKLAIEQFIDDFANERDIYKDKRHWVCNQIFKYKDAKSCERIVKLSGMSL